MEGCKSSERGLEPNLSSACSQPRIVPGTPTPRPLVTRSAKGIGCSRSRVYKAVGFKGRRGGLAAVDGRDAFTLGVVDDHKPTATDTARVRLGDAKGCRRGDRCVGRVPPVFQDLHPHLRRIEVHRRHGAARSGRGRLLRRPSRRAPLTPAARGRGRRPGSVESAGVRSNDSCTLPSGSPCTSEHWSRCGFVPHAAHSSTPPGSFKVSRARARLDASSSRPR